MVKPSDQALKMLVLAQKAANKEVKKHLHAGREVYGRRDGLPVTIKPKLWGNRQLCESEVERFVDQWHNSAECATTDLHVFLGMSWDEYSKWVTGRS